MRERERGELEEGIADDGQWPRRFKEKRSEEGGGILKPAKPIGCGREQEPIRVEVEVGESEVACDQREVCWMDQSRPKASVYKRRDG